MDLLPLLGRLLGIYLFVSIVLTLRYTDWSVPNRITSLVIRRKPTKFQLIRDPSQIQTNQQLNQNQIQHQIQNENRIQDRRKIKAHQYQNEVNHLQESVKLPENEEETKKRTSEDREIKIDPVGTRDEKGHKMEEDEDQEAPGISISSGEKNISTVQIFTSRGDPPAVTDESFFEYYSNVMTKRRQLANSQCRTKHYYMPQGFQWNMMIYMREEKIIWCPVFKAGSTSWIDYLFTDISLASKVS